MTKGQLLAITTAILVSSGKFEDIEDAEDYASDMCTMSLDLYGED